MNLEATTDAEAYRKAFDAYREIVRSVPSQALPAEAKPLFGLAARLTPPRSLSQGRKAVKRDIERALQPMRPSTFTDPAVAKMIRKGDVEGLKAFAARASGGRWDVVRFSEQYHLERRDFRGRVARGSGLMTPDTSELRAYIGKVQARVGMGRGGWAAGVLGLGGTQPTWVSRWASAGHLVNRAKDPVNPYVETANRSPWARRGDDDRVIANAVKTRTSVILANVERRLAEASQKAGLN